MGRLERRRIRRGAVPLVLATVSGLVIGACGTATPGVSVSPAPSTSLVLDAFVRDFATAHQPFHVVELVLMGGTISGSLKVEGDVSRENFDGTIHIDARSSNSAHALEGEVVIVDGAGYVRPPGGSWQKVPDYQPTQPLNPFESLDFSRIEDLGVGPRATSHHLRTTALRRAVTNTEYISDATTRDVVFDIYVNDRGLPLQSRLTLVLEGKIGGRPGTINMSVDYTFSNVGQPVVVRPPVIP